MQRQKKTPTWQYVLLIIGLIGVAASFGNMGKKMGWWGRPINIKAKDAVTRKAEAPPVAAKTTGAEKSAGEPTAPSQRKTPALEDLAVQDELASISLSDRDPTARWYSKPERTQTATGPTVAQGAPAHVAPPTPLAAFPAPLPGAGALPGPSQAVRRPTGALEVAYAPALPERVRRPRHAARLVGTITTADGRGLAVMESGGEGAGPAAYVRAGDEMSGRRVVRAVSRGRVELGGAFRREVLELSTPGGVREASGPGS